jgi:hypothetical protein
VSYISNVVGISGLCILVCHLPYPEIPTSLEIQDTGR